MATSRFAAVQDHKVINPLTAKFPMISDRIAKSAIQTTTLNKMPFRTTDQDAKCSLDYEAQLKCCLHNEKLTLVKVNPTLA